MSVTPKIHINKSCKSQLYEENDVSSTLNIGTPFSCFLFHKTIFIIIFVNADCRIKYSIIFEKKINFEQFLKKRQKTSLLTCLVENQESNKVNKTSISSFVATEVITCCF
jgi:hypothetical protein